MPEVPPQDAVDLNETGPQITALQTAAALVTSIRAGRQLSDIPPNDPYWNAVNAYIALDSSIENL